MKASGAPSSLPAAIVLKQNRIDTKRVSALLRYFSIPIEFGSGATDSTQIIIFYKVFDRFLNFQLLSFI
jgi:hypothetical protein